jgi:tetratricopeptide (TPR) repeat protein
MGRREWILLGGILLFGLLLRSAYLAEVRNSPAFEYPAFDAAFNDYWARCLVDGEWPAPQFYSNPHIDKTPFFRPPGYPYFLAGIYTLTGKSYLGARVLQMVLGLASCILAFLLGRLLFGRSVGLIFAGLTSCYWIFIYFEGELQSPVLLVFLTLLGMLVLARCRERTTYRNTIAAGVIIGLLALAIPNALVLAPVAAIWSWWIARRRRDPRRFRVALVGLSLGVVLAIVPATVRNYVVAGDLVPITSNAGINFYIGNNETTDCVTANAPILGVYTGLGSWTCFDEPSITAAVEKIVGRRLKSSEVSAYFTRKALAHIAAHPARTVRLMARKAALFWGPAEVSNNEVLQFDRERSNVLRFLPGFPLALALAIAGLLLLWLELRAGPASKTRSPVDHSRRVELIGLLLSFVVVYFASYLPFFAAGRYRVPIIPVLLLFGAYGIEAVRSKIARRRIRDAAVWIGVFAVAYLGARVEVATYRPDLGMWHFLRGDAYRKQGNTELARVEFAEAVRSSEIPNAIAYNNLGATLDRMGQKDEAITQFERAIEINPNFLDARRNLVTILLRLNRVDAAATQLAEIVRLDPTDVAARFNLGVCLMRESKAGEAVGHLAEAARLTPNNLNAQVYFARALVLAGRPVEAVAQYQVALKLAENNPDVRFELAELLAKNGAREETVAQLRQVLRLKPDHEGARKLMGELGAR